jgi:putative FmdB family regulatory protein
MPIYEYKCTQCGYQLEALQKTSEDPLTQCPDCQGPTLQKLVSAAGFQLKGTGWYATDFRNKGKTTEKTESSSSSTSGDNKKDSKKDSGAA